MPTNRWLDRSQPQTLVIATVLLYINAALGLIGLVGSLNPLAAVFIVGQGLAGWGIANDKKWAWWLGVVLSVVILAELVAFFNSVGIISLLFQVALVALLLHPQSRSYKRLWFR